MTEDQYILAYCQHGAGSDKFSLWLRREASDYLTVGWAGRVIRTPLYNPGYSTRFDPNTYVEWELTQAQGQAAIMVARSVPENAWYRYAKRLMKGKLP